MTQKKYVFLLSALLSVSLLMMSACSNGGNNTANPAPGANEGTATINKTGMPIANEPVHLKGLVAKYELVRDWNEHKGLKDYEAKSNVIIDWDSVPQNTFEERRNLLFASNDLPDFVMRAMLSPQLITSYAASGQIIPLDDYIEAGYAPNLSALMEANDGIRKSITSADGHIYSLPNISEADGRIASSWINKQWLDKLGLAMPTTMDEFYEVLKAFKEQDPNGNGKADELPISGYKENNSSGNEFFRSFYGSWGFGGNSGIIAPYMDVDDAGKIRYIATDDTFKDMLTFFSKLWAEGLIDKEIFSQDMNQVVSKVDEERIGYVAKGNNNLWMGDNRGHYVQNPVFKAIDGDVYWTGVSPKVRDIGSFVITSKNPNPAATLRWADYFLSEEGTALARLGIQDVTYTIDGDGFYKLKDEFANNPNGLTVDEALSEYTIFQGGNIPQRVTQNVDQSAAVLPEMIANKDVIRPFLVPDEKLMIPNFTEEENIQLSTYATDIEAFTDEQIVKFITGARPIDDWEKFVETLDKMKLDKYLAIYQAAYDRWNQQ
ncbi:sugar ABC transporter substrate-binding protein [Paenibacillus lautus]|uniref:extracellular solute-binding protein n=1 Tax=Paenibacillus lautus TaxID=1401 RepID=UPI001B25D32F|nr:extracellular solute-binding protein [Paenibacillus lautus]GIO98987.1 sugar ABC transporter substrate-binding protein [Paenibacillus lautus]